MEERNLNLFRARKRFADATVVLVAESGDHILTSDPGDLRRLANTAGARVAVVAC